MFKRFLKSLGFHKCEYEKIGFREADNGYIRYSIRHYRCTICGHEKWVDGRFDKN